jgi:ComF family protein
VAALTRRRPRTTPVALATLRTSHFLARLLSKIRGPVRDLLEFALPQRCPGCGDAVEPTHLLCARCLARIPALEHPVCARCLRDGEVPDRCVRHPHDRVHAAWVYDERAALLVHALKFGSRPGLARTHVGALVRALPARARRVSLVTSVPLHAARRRERGYDQAACLGEALADAIGAPYVADVLRRVRPTRAQSGLGPEERRRNVRGAFEVVRPAWLAGRRVLLVDDVVTTGATLAEALAAVRGAGARPAGAALAWAQ